MRQTPTLLFLAALVATSCEKAPALPEGVSLRLQTEKDLVVTLREDTAIQVRQEGADGRIIIVSNQDGALSVLQLERGGATPRRLDLISGDVARYTVTPKSTDGFTMILDEDGDGLPDVRVESRTMYRRVGIDWEKVTPPQK